MTSVLFAEPVQDAIEQGFVAVAIVAVLCGCVYWLARVRGFRWGWQISWLFGLISSFMGIGFGGFLLIGKGVSLSERDQLSRLGISLMVAGVYVAGHLIYEAVVDQVEKEWEEGVRHRSRRIVFVILVRLPIALVFLCVIAFAPNGTTDFNVGVFSGLILDGVTAILNQVRREASIPSKRHRRSRPRAQPHPRRPSLPRRRHRAVAAAVAVIVMVVLAATTAGPNSPTDLGLPHGPSGGSQRSR